MLVTSPVPMSSSRARRTISVMTHPGAGSVGTSADAAGRSACATGAGEYCCVSCHLGELGFVVGQLGANAVDDFGGRLAQEDFVGKLALGGGGILFELLAFVWLAVGIVPGLGDIEDEIELAGGANHVGLGSSLGFELEGDAGDLLDGFGVSLCDGERSGAAIERAGELLLGIELGLGAEGARQGDDFLNDGDFLFGLGVGEFGAVLRVGGERDGFRVALGEVEALPELFGEEGHGGMEQAQGGLEGGGGVAPAGGAYLLQLEIPIAELVPEELPELLGELVVAILLDGAVGGLGGGVEARDDPAVFDGRLGGRGGGLVDRESVGWGKRVDLGG